MSTPISKEALVKGLDVRKNTIKESDFVNVWLPAFVEGDKEVGVAWIQKVSGHPRSPVIVLSQQGEYLFEVPALMPTVKNEEINGANAVIERFDKFNKAGNPAANQFLVKTFSVLGKCLTNDHVDAWIEILGKYGYLDKENQPKETQSRAGDEYEEEALF